MARGEMDFAIDSELFRSIASQLMERPDVSVRGRLFPVKRTSLHHFRSVIFSANGRRYMAIEQNPDKVSRWARLARAGHQVVQFKDMSTNRFIAVALDGVVKEYEKMGRRAAS